MLADIQQKAQELLSENASALLTAGGVVGTVGTAVLTGRASYKAYEVILDREDENEDAEHLMSRTQKVALVWPLFLPPVGLGGLTIASIVMANRISAKKAAALAAAYGISERRFEEYKEKALEKLGKNKEQKLRDEIAQDRIIDHPPNQTIIIGGNDVLCYDMLTGRYFKSSVDELKRAENYINEQMLNYDYASLSQFFENVDLPPTNYTDTVGWNLGQDGALEVRLSTTMSMDNKPCIAVDFNNAPHPEYNRTF